MTRFTRMWIGFKAFGRVAAGGENRKASTTCRSWPTPYRRTPPGLGELERIAVSVEAELKRVAGTRDIPPSAGLGVRRWSRSIRQDGRCRRDGSGTAAVAGRCEYRWSTGRLVAGNRTVQLDAGPFVEHVQELEDVVVGVRQDGQCCSTGGHRARGIAAACTLCLDRCRPNPALSGRPSRSRSPKKARMPSTWPTGWAKIAILRNGDPGRCARGETRNYGETANEKARKLIQSWRLPRFPSWRWCFVALGRREALIVGAAVVLTLSATLFASWA